MAGVVRFPTARWAHTKGSVKKHVGERLVCDSNGVCSPEYSARKGVSRPDKTVSLQDDKDSERTRIPLGLVSPSTLPPYTATTEALKPGGTSRRTLDVQGRARSACRERERVRWDGGYARDMRGNRLTGAPSIPPLVRLASQPSSGWNRTRGFPCVQRNRDEHERADDCPSCPSVRPALLRPSSAVIYRRLEGDAAYRRGVTRRYGMS